MSNVYASAINGVAVTVSDSTQVNYSALWVGVGGDVAITHENGGTAVTYKNVPSGSILPVRIKGGQVMNTNTTATNIVGLAW